MKSMPDVEHLFQSVPDFHCIGIGSVFGSERLLGVEEHPCAETHPSVVTLQDIVVPAPLASLPKLIIIRELRECDRLVAHTRI